MYESAEDWFSADPVLGEVDRLGWPGISLGRCELAESTVRAAGVVVLQVLGQHLAQVVLADDQQPVEDFAPQGPDDPFPDSVRFGCLRRAGQNPNARPQEDGVEAGGELAGAVPDQEPDWSRPCAEVDQEVARCLCRPRAVLWGSITRSRRVDRRDLAVWPTGIAP
jgi:hypothetical protein